jgi:hypothetical protein
MTCRRGAAWRTTAAALAASVMAARAGAQSISGRVNYTGGLGPVSFERPLCLCLSSDPQLQVGLGCFIFGTSTATYRFSRLDPISYYLIAFLDIHINERPDPDEPFEIYSDRGALPADPIPGSPAQTGIDFDFGDENLPGAPTPTPSEPPTPISSEPPTATPTGTFGLTPAPPRTPGDCDGDMIVSIADLVRAVAVALETVDVSACPAADLDHDGAVRIDELVAALAVALDGRPL